MITTSQTALLFVTISALPVVPRPSLLYSCVRMTLTIGWTSNALFLICDYMSTTFIYLTAVPFASPHLGHELVVGCIGAGAKRHGAAVVTVARIFYSFGCMKKSDTSIVCLPRLVVCSGLIVKKIRLRISLHHM